MDKLDELHVAEDHLAVLEAVAKAVAYGSPSPAEELRGTLNQRVLALRDELDLDAQDEPRAHEDPEQVEDPAEEADAFEDHEPDPAVDPIETPAPAEEAPAVQSEVPASEAAPQAPQATPEQA